MSLAEYETHTIYALVDSNTREVRYVGATWRTLRIRLTGHLSDATQAGKRRSQSTTEKNKWILSLKDSGQTPLIVTLEENRGQTGPCREKFWIDEMKRRGARLCNASTVLGWHHQKDRKNPRPTSLKPVSP